MGSAKTPPPDPAQQELARAQVDEMRASREFNKTAYADYMSLAREQAARGDEQWKYQTGLQEKAEARSQRYEDRYWDTTAKQQDAFYKRADEYDSETYQDSQVGKATADVEAQLDIGRGALSRGLAARGMNPGSDGYAAAVGDMELQGALSKASAATMAREAAKREGLNIRATAAGLGGNLTGAGASYLGASGALGQSALGDAGTGLSSSLSGVNMYNQGQGVAMNWGNSASTGLNSLWGQKNAGAQAKQAEGNAWGSAAAGLASAATYAWIASDRRLKTEVQPIGQLDSGLTVYRYRYKTGGALRIGVMADEVARLVPQAYIRGGAGEGYDAVDYAAL